MATATRRVYFDLNVSPTGQDIRAIVAEVTPERGAFQGLAVEIVSADIDLEDLDCAEQVARDEYRENFR